MSDTNSLLIEAGHARRHYWRDLWRYNELFLFLAWRDILIRYKQTVIGAPWVLVRPLLMMIVLTIVFGKLARLPSENVPYPILVFTALLPWQFFSSCLGEAGNSLINNSHIISKVYFPRIIIPVSAMMVNLVDLFIAGIILIGLMLLYGMSPNWHIISLPLFVIMAIGSAMGPSLWIAALNVKHRDFRFIIPLALQIGLYISPIGFSSNIIPEKWRLLYSLNPLVGVIDGFRWALLGDNIDMYWPGFLLSTGVIILLLISGIIYFLHCERKFADTI